MSSMTDVTVFQMAVAVLSALVQTPSQHENVLRTAEDVLCSSLAPSWAAS